MVFEESKRSISCRIDAVLGRELSPRASQFAVEYADFLVRVTFKNIAEHPQAYIHCAEAYSSCTGASHTIWLDPKSPGFEALMMHETIRGVLIEGGFPKTACHPNVVSCAPLRYLSSLLGSAVMDPVIDGHLVRGNFGVYDREALTRRTMASVLVDARQGTTGQHGYLFCKWALLTVLMRLDPTFEDETVNLLHALIHEEFPEAWEIADELSKSIMEKGFTEPESALTAMLEIRSALRLQDSVAIVDAEGVRR